MKRKFAQNLVLWLFAFAVIFPLLTLLIWAFTERYAWPNILPKHFSLRALESTLIKSKDLLRTFASSILISSVTAFLSVCIALLSARAFAFYEFKGKKWIAFLMLAPFLVPTTVFAMGIQIVFLRIGLGGNVVGVILCHLIYSLPYANRLLEEGTRALGKGLEEQARLFGCSAWHAFFAVSLPNLLPSIVSAFTMSYIISVSQYFLTLLIGGGNIKTFAVVMVPYMQSGERNFAGIYALIFLCVTVGVFFLFEALAAAWSKGIRTEYFNG